MAIKDEISRLQQAKQDFKTKLIEKGVTVSDEELISDYPPKLDLIKGGANTTDATATANEIRKGFTAYIASGKVEGTIEDYDGTFEILVVLPEEPDVPEDPEDPDFPATSSLVYTLSDDGTYYIVGTGCNTKEKVVQYGNSEGDVGSGLDSTWSGGEVYVPNTYNGLPVLAINKFAFKGITNITGLYIQEGITHIGIEILNGCYNVETLSLPFISSKKEYENAYDSVYPLSYTFGETSFSDSYQESSQKSYKVDESSGTYYYGYVPNKLTKFTINGGYIRPYSFYGLRLVKEIILKENIDYSLSTKTFGKCYSLIKLVIDTNELIPLKSSEAFTSCYHILGTVNSTYNPNGDKDGYIYVPDSLVENYKSATNWSTYATQIKPLSELEE